MDGSAFGKKLKFKLHHPRRISVTKKFVVEVTPAHTGHVFAEWGEVFEERVGSNPLDNPLFKNPESVSLVVFTGGEDVWPELYGEKEGFRTWHHKERDHYEADRFEQALKHKIPMVGVCRGAQFLCVKAGGKLVQHITGHGGNHTVRNSEGKLFTVNSTHHQMQLPPKDAVPLAWAEPKLSKCYLNGDDEERTDVDREYEIVYYPSIRAMGIQSHPEWLAPDHESVKYAKSIVKKYLFNG